MVWTVTVFLIAGSLLLVQSVWAFADGARFRRLVRRKRSTAPGNYTPSAAVVIPCKGIDPGFAANLERFLAQDYPGYQVVFVVATERDKAYQNLRERLGVPVAPGAIRRARTSLIVAGFSAERGEKVNNLLRGIERVEPDTQVLVFADIDAAPSPDWLRCLVARLADPQITVSTGFRWYLPGSGLASRLRAAWDTSIATMLGDHDHNFAWGGSMAIRASDFRRLEIAERYWAKTVSDDFALTRAIADARGRIAFEPRCLVVAREESSVREFFRWSTRQIIITRVYAPHWWVLGLAAHLLYCATFAFGAGVMVMPGASAHQRLAVAAFLIAVLLLGAGKGFIRSLVTRELFAAEIDNGTSCYWRLSPLVPWVMLWNFVMAGLSRRIEWRGTKYELVSCEQVRVIERSCGCE